MAEGDDTLRSRSASRGWAGLRPLPPLPPDPRLTPVERGSTGLGGADGARLREVGRLLDTVRVVDQLRELGALDPGQLRDLGQWIEGGGLAGGEARWPNAFWGSRQGRGEPLGDLRIPGLSNLGASETLGNRGSGFGMDHRDYDPDAQRGSRDPYGVGTLGLVADSFQSISREDDEVDVVTRADFRWPPFGQADTRLEPVGEDDGTIVLPEVSVPTPAEAARALSESGQSGASPDPSVDEDMNENGVPDWVDDLEEGDHGVDAGDPADAGRRDVGPDETTAAIAALARLLLSRVGSGRTPPAKSSAGGARVRPQPVEVGNSGSVGPRLVIGGLADEPRLRRGRIATRSLAEALARIGGTRDPSRGSDG